MKSEEELPEDQFKRLVAQMASARSDESAGNPEPSPSGWPMAPASGLRRAARTMLQRVAAALRFDSNTITPTAVGLRGSMAETRHLLFSAKGRDIDLRITPTAGVFALSGQVLGPDETGRVELCAHVRGQRGPFGGARRATALDALGEFHLDEVDVGTYVLTLRMGGDEIVLPPIDVGGVEALKPGIAPRENRR